MTESRDKDIHVIRLMTMRCYLSRVYDILLLDMTFLRIDYYVTYIKHHCQNFKGYKRLCQAKAFIFNHT